VAPSPHTAGGVAGRRVMLVVNYLWSPGCFVPQDFRLVCRVGCAAPHGVRDHGGQAGCLRCTPQPVSLLDRLLRHSVVVATEGESFRMRQARAKGGIARTVKTSRK
jgi:hypothetical protein